MLKPLTATERRRFDLDMRRGDIVRYDAQGGRMLVEALVKTLHRDDSVTVEPRFFLTSTGRRMPCYIGGKVRLHRSDLFPDQ